MNAFSYINAPTSKFNKMDYNARIASEIADLESQIFTNITAAAKEWDVDRTTLSKRFHGKNRLKRRCELLRTIEAYEGLKTNSS